MKKGIGVIIVLAIMVSIFAGCTRYQRHIYNDDSKVAAAADSYSFGSRIGNTYDDKTKFKFSRFYGTETLWTVDAKEEGTITLEIKADVENGKFKAVLISPDKEVSTIFEGSKEEKLEVKVPKGKSRIKVVGDGAKGDISIKIKESDNIKVKKS
jgi:hypothetical protein